MNQLLLDRFFQQRRQNVTSSLPSSFSQDVWREIRQRKSKDTVNRLSFWGWLLKPEVVFATLMMAMTVGIGLGSRNFPSQTDQTHEALNLEVFGKAAHALPSTLLTSNP